MQITIPLIVGLLLAGALFAGVVALVRVTSRQQKALAAKRDLAWKTLAEELEGEQIEATGPWYRRQPAHLALQVSGQRVLLDHYVVSTGQTSVTYTRARCPSEASTGHRLSVSKDNAIYGIGKMLGMQDVEVHDHAYDEAFFIRTDDPDWAQRVLAEPIRAVHLPAPENSLTIQDGMVMATRAGMQTELEGLRRQIGLCAVVAQSIETA